MAFSCSRGVVGELGVSQNMLDSNVETGRRGIVLRAGSESMG